MFLAQLPGPSMQELLFAAIPVGTVKSRLSRAHQRLRAELDAAAREDIDR